MLLTLGLLVGCKGPGPAAQEQAPLAGPPVATFESLTSDTFALHDEKRHVTCWISSSTGYNMAISCLPDKSFEAQ